MADPRVKAAQQARVASLGRALKAATAGVADRYLRTGEEDARLGESDEWEGEEVDAGDGVHKYFYNSVTGESQWEKPADMLEAVLAGSWRKLAVRLERLALSTAQVSDQ